MYGRSDGAQEGNRQSSRYCAGHAGAPFRKIPHGAERAAWRRAGPLFDHGPCPQKDGPCAQNLPGAGAAVSSALLFSQRTVPCFSAKPGPAESGSPPGGQQRNSTRCLPRKRVPGHGRAQKHSPFQRPVHHGRQPAVPGFCCGRKRQFALYFIGKIMYSRSENKAENM